MTYVSIYWALCIERDSVQTHLPWRKVESLLAYLLLNPEKQSRNYLATSREPLNVAGDS